MEGSAHTPDTATPPPKPARASVVLLRAPGTSVPPELLEALTRNQSDPIEVDHALSALAHLCLNRPAVLLLCEPGRLAASGPLLGAVERYTPRATVWEYVSGESPALRPHEPAPASSDMPAHLAPPPTHGHTDSFALRLSTDPLAATKASASITGEILSRDELEALFSEDPR